MDCYDLDTEAEAVVLYENVKIDYMISANTPIMVRQFFTKRIKILKQNGVEYADGEILEYKSPTAERKLFSLDAASYNLENGKVVKSVLKNQYVFREKVSEYNTRIKFSLPNVKEGSIVEYRYVLSSDITTSIPTVYFQHDIPVVYSSAEIDIPEYYTFNANVRGYHPVSVKRSEYNSSVAGVQNSVSYAVREIHAEAKDVPAMKKESMVWNRNNYYSCMDFEIKSVSFPGVSYRSYSHSWRDVYEALDKSSFRDHIRMSNPLHKEMIGAIPADGDEYAKIRAILQMLHTKIKWNGECRLISDSPRAALNKSEGSSADINFILAAMLRDAGFNVVPVLLNPRFMSKIYYPTLKNINYFIIKVFLSNGEVCYVDGTNEYSDINVLPISLLVDNARVYMDTSSSMLDLTAITDNTTSANILAVMKEDGIIEIQSVRTNTNMCAMQQNSDISEYTDLDAYFEAKEKSMNREFEEHSLVRTNTKVQTELKYTVSPNRSDEYVYVNSTVISAINDNPFTSVERKLPIEFPYPYTETVRCTLKLPDGYTVEEYPKSQVLVACNGGLKSKYAISVRGNIVQIIWTMSVCRALFAPSEYTDISAFFGHLSDTGNSNIVIKRKQL